MLGMKPQRRYPLLQGIEPAAGPNGLRVVSSDSAAIGHVVAVEDFGAGDVIEIERPDGKRFMAPMNADAVPEWNDERLVIDPAFVV